MKKYIMILLSVISSAVFLNSCEDLPEPYGSAGTPGFSVTFTLETDTLAFTKQADASVTAKVDISGKWVVTSEAMLDRFEVYKVLFSRSGEEVARGLVLRDVTVGDSVQMSISSEDELFDGLGVTPDEVTIGSYIVLEAVGIYPSGNDMRVTDRFVVEGEYIDFCDIPSLELGIWTATNTTTGFTKDVELLWLEEQQQYGFTDFGLDWSWITAQWPGTLFTLKCPLVDGDPIYVDLSGVFVWEYGNIIEMPAPSGELETREVIHFGYIYQPESPVGYYDEATGNLVFKNINITDSAWNWDKHEDISMVFKKKE